MIITLLQFLKKYQGNDIFRRKVHFINPLGKRSLENYNAEYL